MDGEDSLFFYGRHKRRQRPIWGIVFDAAGNIYGSTNQGGKYVNGTVYKLVASDGRYKEKILWNFNGTDGSGPYDSLILDGGNLYGTTYGGGSSEQALFRSESGLQRPQPRSCLRLIRPRPEKR